MKQFAHMTEPEIRKEMTALAKTIQRRLPDGELFCLVTFNKDMIGQYVSSGNRSDVVKAMSKRQPKDIVEPWPATTFIMRLAYCKSMLALHGFLTESETRRVHKRLMKFIETKNLPPLR